MRQPVFMGFREDKSPKDVHREEMVAEEKAVEKAQAKPKPAAPHKATALKLTHLDKVYWPEAGYTKGDLIAYYESVADLILPYLKDRPIVLNRFPNGIHGSSFYQKDVDSPLPDFVETVDVYSESNAKNLHMVLCQNKETLLYLANLGCIEMNPWNARTPKLHYPDYLIIDLDPGEIGFEAVIETAQTVKQILDDVGAPSYCKTSGATGLHIFVPLGAQYEYEFAREFTHLIVTLVHQQLPKTTSIERSPAKRKNKIYLDYLQNTMGQTIASVYSVRPNPEAKISIPLEWKEVKPGLDPAAFNLKTIHQHLKKKGDLWQPVLEVKADLQACLKKVETLLSERS